jgi:hypothetical protein
MTGRPSIGSAASPSASRRYKSGRAPYNVLFCSRCSSLSPSSAVILNVCTWGGASDTARFQAQCRLLGAFIATNAVRGIGDGSRNPDKAVIHAASVNPAARSESAGAGSSAKIR